MKDRLRVSNLPFNLIRFRLAAVISFTVKLPLRLVFAVPRSCIESGTKAFISSKSMLPFICRSQRCLSDKSAMLPSNTTADLPVFTLSLFSCMSDVLEFILNWTCPLMSRKIIGNPFCEYLVCFISILAIIDGIVSPCNLPCTSPDTFMLPSMVISDIVFFRLSGNRLIIFPILSQSVSNFISISISFSSL